MDGGRKIKKIPKCRELSYLGTVRFLFLKKISFLKKKIKWKSEKSSTSQKKIYNKRYSLNFRIRKPTVPR